MLRHQGDADDGGDTANRRWCFLGERFFKEPSKGLFVTNSRGSRLPPPVCLVVPSMFPVVWWQSLVNLVEVFCAFVTQSDGEFTKARAIIFPQCRRQKPPYLPRRTDRFARMWVWWK